MKKSSFLIVTVFLFFIFVHPANASAVIFQDGLNGYAGTQDTMIGSNGWAESNFGTKTTLYLKENNKTSHILIFFDISSILDGGSVTSAVLSLYKIANSVDPIASVYKITSGSWSEGDNGAATYGDVDWNHRIHGNNGSIPSVPWNVPGLGAGSDYDATAADSESLTSAGWYNWDVTSIVQDWYNGISPNYGFVMKASGTEPSPDPLSWYQIIASSEYANGGGTGWRPKLTINQVPEPATLSLLGLGLLGIMGRLKRRKPC